MIKLLEFLWHGCWHNWVPVASGPLISQRAADPIGKYYTYACSHCQRRKDINVY